jgi:predicted hydrocarbon binding protein
MARKRSARKRSRREHDVHGKDVVTLEEAKEQVGIALTRAALLHLAFSRTLVEELGEQKGKELVMRAIMEYGRRVGERVKRGLLDLPKYGIFGTEMQGGSGDKWFENYRAYDCVFARTFKEYGELDLGYLYCYVDAAKTMTQDSTQKLIHRDCAACGDDFCTFEVMPTTEQERSDFSRRHSDWKHVDPRLAERVRHK